MSSLSERLGVLESLIIRCATNSLLRDDLLNLSESIKASVLSRIPADDVRASFESFITCVKNCSVKYDEFAVFISRLKNIISSLDSLIPLGLKSRSDLVIIRREILDSLSVASERFKQSFPGESLFDTTDTHIFIVGSRARGFSRDGKWLFSPGRDVDLLVVGEGIFFSELSYMHLKGLNDVARKAERRGYVEGFDRRFIPPGMRRAAEKIRELFDRNTSFSVGGSPGVVVNIHIGRISSEKVQKEIPFAIECV
ncbi:hypothetical protein HY483_02405 [Candidatus Woesearchaeota archaeon]|nr:hypothetical protein [Candidatus Woesearchaeota archaeon]